MNNPLNKIDISKSSLLGLKAELLRKKNEFDKLKLSSSLTKPNKKIKKLQKPKEVSLKEPIDPEEIELLRKSKEILEKKAKIYENLTTPGTSTEGIDDIYLVHFSEKQSETLDDILNNKQNSEASSSETEDENSSEDEIEYVDYFGRTHIYPRRDIQMYIEKDKRLSKMLQLFPSDKLVQDMENINITNNKTEIVQKDMEKISSEMKRDLMRQEWEKQEELLKKKNVIHYQDILFNEARMHGVAYYQFSSDDTERALQHKALDDLRHETLQEQKQRAEHRMRRELERKNRVLAAKNRVRARKGLPPLQLLEESSIEKPKELTEEERLAVEKAEREARYEKKKEAMRSLYVRPWDEDKEGIPVFTEITQEKWVEKKRNQREADFAPPSFYKTESKCKTTQEYNPAEPSSPQSSSASDDGGSEQVIEDKLKFLRSKLESPLNEDHENPEVNQTLRFSTKKINLKRKNMNNFIATPIINELSDNSTDDEHTSAPRHVPDKAFMKRGAEIPPPLTFEHFGPNSKNIKSKKIKTTNVEESITAGLEYLKDKIKNKRKVNIDHLDM